ncbi:MAG: hypothetical protein WDN75_09275 [Bacteroidota bacterium]
MIERDFLAALHGGCSVPIAALAREESDQIIFKGNVVSLDASNKIDVELSFTPDQIENAGSVAAQKIKEAGADRIVQSFRPA